MSTGGAALMSAINPYRTQPVSMPTAAAAPTGGFDINSLGSMTKKQFKALRNTWDGSQLEYGWENAIDTNMNKKTAKRLRKLLKKGGIKPYQIATDQLTDMNTDTWDTADSVFGDAEDYVRNQDESQDYQAKIDAAKASANQQIDIAEGTVDRRSRALGLNPLNAEQQGSRARRTSLARAISQVDAANRSTQGMGELRDQKDEAAFDMYAQDTAASQGALANLANMEADRQSSWRQSKDAKKAGLISTVGTVAGMAAMAFM